MEPGIQPGIKPEIYDMGLNRSTIAYNAIVSLSQIPAIQERLQKRKEAQEQAAAQRQAEVVQPTSETTPTQLILDHEELSPEQAAQLLVDQVYEEAA